MYPELRQKVEEYVDWIGPQYSGGSVLEIGSYDYCGGVKDLFTGRYVGVDRQPGKGVDIVMNAQYLNRSFLANDMDVVVWLESIEHDEAFWLTSESILEVLRPDGYLIMSAPEFLFPLHECPDDYYRFTVSAISELLTPYHIVDLSTLRGEGNPANMGTITALARKR